MKVKIQVKKLGKSHSKIAPVFYDYPENVDTVRRLLEETVRINLEEYGKRRRHTEVEAVLSKESMEEQAGAGKITFLFRTRCRITEGQRRTHASVLKME